MHLSAAAASPVRGVCIVVVLVHVGVTELQAVVRATIERNRVLVR